MQTITRPGAESHDVIFHHLDLPGGAEAVLEQVTGVPFVALCLGFSVGSRHDPPGQSGMAHLFEHLRFAETARLRRGEFLSAVGSWGGLANATTSSDMTRFYSVVPADRFSDLIDLEEDRFAYPVSRMTEANLKTEKAVVLSERLQTVVNRPYGAVAHEAAHFVYRAGSGYYEQPIGTVDGVEAATTSSCVAFSDRYYVSGGLRIAVVGDLTPDEATRYLTRIARSLPQRDPETPATAAPPDSAGTIRASAASAWPRRLYACLGLPPAAHDEFELARLGAFWLGRGAGSLLARALVKDRFLAVSVKLKTMARQDEASLGLIEIMPAPGAGDSEIFGRLRAVLEEAAVSGPPPPELDRARAMYSSDWALEDDGVLNRARNIAGTWLTKGTPGAHLSLPTRICQLSPAELARSAAAWASGKHRLELTYG